MIYDRVVEELRYNRQLRKEGKYPCIPWLSMPKLSTVIPGILKSKYIIVTANSKIGKTKLTDHLYLYEPLKFIKEIPDSNIKLKIFYFTLEVSKEEKIRQMLCNKIYKDYGKEYSPEQLLSYFKGQTLNGELLKIFESQEYRDYFKFIEENVAFIDKVRNPFGIYHIVREFARKNGKFVNKEGLEVKEGEIYDHYVPNDPDLYVEVIVDHLALLTPEKGKSLHQTMSEFSNDYCLKMRDNFKYTIINVVQQSAESEKQQFDFKGNSIVNKLRPSADGLGDNKLIGRDCNLMLGLFSPYRYKIDEYEGFDISAYKDTYRELSIILNRDGGGSINLDLLFKGAVNHFEEINK